MAVWVWHLRARAPRFALALVVCQLAALSFSTLVLAASQPPGALTVGAHEECSCDHTTGVMCPMHRRSASRPIPANVPRWCKGVDGSTYAVLPVLGTLAMPERVALFAVPAVESTPPAFRAASPRPLDHPPDNPPPRV